MNQSKSTNNKRTTKNRISGFSVLKNPNNLARMGVLTALSFVLYAFLKFPLPVIFPYFLDFQFSDLPALIGGFSMGPIAAGIIIVVKCCLKMPLTSTACVGELADILIGLAFVLPASAIYFRNKNKKNALVGIIVGMSSSLAVSLLANYVVLVPFYIKLFFDGNWQTLIGSLTPLYSKLNRENFYTYYLLLGVIPFNALRLSVVASICIPIYKPLSRFLHDAAKDDRQFDSQNDTCDTQCDTDEDFDEKKYIDYQQTGENEASLECRIFNSNSVDQTIEFGKEIAKQLQGGDVVVLSGQLGAGKTHLCKGIAQHLGISETITSPTFALHNIYKGDKLYLHHFDMYRLESGEELYLGFEEFIGQKDSITVIEWAENTPSLTPQHFVKIEIEKCGENQRTITVSKA